MVTRFLFKVLFFFFFLLLYFVLFVSVGKLSISLV